MTRLHKDLLKFLLNDNELSPELKLKIASLLIDDSNSQNSRFETADRANNPYAYISVILRKAPTTDLLEIFEREILPFVQYEAYGDFYKRLTRKNYSALFDFLFEVSDGIESDTPQSALFRQRIYDFISNCLNVSCRGTSNPAFLYKQDMKFYLLKALSRLDFEIRMQTLERDLHLLEHDRFEGWYRHQNYSEDKTAKSPKGLMDISNTLEWLCPSDNNLRYKEDGGSMYIPNFRLSFDHFLSQEDYKLIIEGVLIPAILKWSQEGALSPRTTIERLVQFCTSGLLESETRRELVKKYAVPTIVAFCESGQLDVKYLSPALSSALDNINTGEDRERLILNALFMPKLVCGHDNNPIIDNLPSKHRGDFLVSACGNEGVKVTFLPTPEVSSSNQNITAVPFMLCA
jgi:hypothetical protein